MVGGDAPSKAFVAATNRVGLSLNYDSMQLSDYRISCVGTALKLYDQLGEEIYCEALRHIVAAWEGRPDSFRAAVLRGVMYFVQLYRGQYSEERLVRALRSLGDYRATDAALAAELAFAGAEPASALAASRVGRMLSRAGLDDEIAHAAACDSSAVVPVLRDGVLVRATA